MRQRRLPLVLAAVHRFIGKRRAFDRSFAAGRVVLVQAAATQVLATKLLKKRCIACLGARNLSHSGSCLRRRAGICLVPILLPYPVPDCPRGGGRKRFLVQVCSVCVMRERGRGVVVPVSKGPEFYWKRCSYPFNLIKKSLYGGEAPPVPVGCS